MPVQDDLTTIAESRDSDIAIIDFWSAAEYAYRTMKEQLEKMNEAKAGVDLPSCPDTIKQNGQGVLDKLQALIDALEAQHLDFLSWTLPE